MWTVFAWRAALRRQPPQKLRLGLITIVNNFFKKPLDKPPVLWYIVTMKNDLYSFEIWILISIILFIGTLAFGFYIESLWITFIKKPLDNHILLWYIITMKARKSQNVVKTTTEMNIAAAVLNDTLRDAEVHFRALQHANGRGTTESQYAELEEAWIAKVGLGNYIFNGE